MDTPNLTNRYDNTSYQYLDRGKDKRIEVEKHLSSGWSREELEDKYLRLYAENKELRETKAKQDDRIKLLTTKLERLLQDRKKLLAGDQTGPRGGSNFTVQEYEDRINALEAQNSKLKAKLENMNNLLKNSGKGAAFSGATSRINTGLPKSESRSLQQSGLRSISPMAPKASRQMIDDFRSDNAQLRAEIGKLHQALDDANGRIEDGQRKLTEANNQYQEDINRIKQSMTSDQRVKTQSNIQQVKIQRDLNDKTAKLQVATEQLRKLEAQLEQYRLNEQQLKRQVDKLQTDLQVEQERRVNIHEELKSTSAVARTAPELETKLNDIATENLILKETNERLTQNAFNVDVERGPRDRETAYRVQIQQLESTLKADVGEKTSILEKLAEERANTDKVRNELKEEKARNAQLNHKLDALQDKMRIFSNTSAVDFDELGEALLLIRERKRVSNAAQAEAQILKSLTPQLAAQVNEPKDFKKLYDELSLVHAETANELDRTRAILSVQYRINNDYAKEVEATTRRLESIQSESESRLQEYAKLLDLRLARIRKLEARLRDLAYGVRPLRPMAMVASTGPEIEENKELESGQNIFEIHLDTLRLGDESVRLLGASELTVFCTWGFYEFELQKSPVVKSHNKIALFDCTSQYIVTVDDFLLSYLAHKPLIIELHRSLGALKYETIGVARVSLRDLLDSQDQTCRMSGTTTFTGVTGVLEAAQVAEVDFWVLLRVPIPHAFRLFRERLKALNYLVSDAKSRDAALNTLAPSGSNLAPGDNVNILHVHIIRCQKLVAFNNDQNARQPSAYIAYKLLDFPEHITATVPEASSPQFNDHNSFTLYTTVDTDRFLKTEALTLFVFDDVAADSDATAYLGRARVPLIGLANNQPVQGPFELTRSDGTASGIVEVKLAWQFEYKPPSNLTMVGPPQLGPDNEIPEVPVRDVEASKFAMTSPSRAPTSVLLGKGVQAAEAQANIQAKPSEAIAPPVPVQSVVPAAPVQVAQQAVSNLQLVPDSVPVVAPVPVEPVPLPTPAASVVPVAPAVAPVVPVAPAVASVVQQVAEPQAQPPAAATKAGEAVVAKSQSESGSQPEVIFESDSEGVVVETSRLPKSVRQSLEQVVTVTIHSLRIKPNSSIATDDNVTQLFVAFDFDGIAQDELETPLSLPKPTGGSERDLMFNFTKVIPVSAAKNATNREFLSQLLSGNDRRDRSLVFSVVSESVESDECDDIAEALVDVKDIADREDVREKEFEVRSLADNSVVGSLKLTIICHDVLASIKQDSQPRQQPNTLSSSPTL